MEQQVIGPLESIGIGVPAAIGFFVLGRRACGRGIAACLGVLALLFGLGAYVAVVQGESLRETCTTDMCGANELTGAYLFGFFAAMLAAARGMTTALVAVPISRGEMDNVWYGSLASTLWLSRSITRVPSPDISHESYLRSKLAHMFGKCVRKFALFPITDLRFEEQGTLHQPSPTPRQFLGTSASRLLANFGLSNRLLTLA